MTTSNNSKIELTQAQLEWTTQKSSGQPIPADASESQIEEMQSLEQAWDWFGSLLENAADEDYLPPNAAAKSSGYVQQAREQKSQRSRLSYYIALGTVSAAIALVCGFWALRQFDSSSAITNNQGAQQVAQNTDVPAPSADNNKTQPAQGEIAKSDATVQEDVFTWDEDDAYDTQLTSLTNSMLSAESSDRWELSAMAEYTTVGYEMSQINELDKF